MNVIVVNENKAILDQLDVDVIKKIEGQFEVSELLGKFVNLYFDKLIIDVTAIKDYTNLQVIEKFAHDVDASRVLLLLNDTPIVNSNEYLANLVKNGIYNFSRNLEGIKFLYNTPNSLSNVEYILNQPKEGVGYSTGTTSASYYNNEPKTSVNVSTAGKKIIGLANMTMHAGASTLTNMMVRQLNAAGIPSIGVEINRQDLIYYRSDKLFSCMSRIDLERVLRDNSDAVGVIIDLNDFPEADKYCNTIVYLAEPSFIRLTKCIRRNKNAFVERKNDKVVLNMSFVSDDEVYDFEIETGVKVFDNIPPLNDRDTNSGEINEFLKKLGFNI
jgi:hypothetical protein